MFPAESQQFENQFICIISANAMNTNGNIRISALDYLPEFKQYNEHMLFVTHRDVEATPAHHNLWKAHGVWYMVFWIAIFGVVGGPLCGLFAPDAKFAGPNALGCEIQRFIIVPKEFSTPEKGYETRSKYRSFSFVAEKQVTMSKSRPPPILTFRSGNPCKYKSFLKFGCCGWSLEHFSARIRSSSAAGTKSELGSARLLCG